LQNFRTDVSSFDKIPSGELYIFPGTPAPADPAAQNTTGPAGEIPQALSYSEWEVEKLSGKADNDSRLSP